MTDKMDDTDDENGTHVAPDCVQWQHWKVGFIARLLNPHAIGDCSFFPQYYF
jgi:hypothetical protein